MTGISTAIAIALGASHACAVLRRGSVQCWGYIEKGQLANRTQTSHIRVAVHEVYAPTSLTAGWRRTCALFSGGVIRCWGAGDYGQLGNWQTTNSTLPTTVVGTPGVVWESSAVGGAAVESRHRFFAEY